MAAASDRMTPVDENDELGGSEEADKVLMAHRHHCLFMFGRKKDSNTKSTSSSTNLHYIKFEGK